MKEGYTDLFKRIIEMITGKKLDHSKRKDTIRLQEEKEMQYIRLKEMQGENVKLTDIPDIYQLLLCNDEEVKLQAAEILNHYMSSLNSYRLLKLDKIFRERSSYEWRFDWRSKDPKELIHPLMSEEEEVVILGLSSFHPNGYFR